MFEEIKKNISSAKLLIWLLTIAALIYLFQIVWQVLGNFSDIIVMLIFAWIISFLLEPPVEKIKNVLKINKMISAVFVYLVFISFLVLIFFIFIPSLSEQFQSLSKIIPQFLKSYPLISVHVDDFVNTSLKNAVYSIPSVANFLFSFFIVIIISFYFVVDNNQINRELIKIIPENWRTDARFVKNIINNTFASFFRVQLLFGLICGVATWLVLRVFSINFAASTAVLSGILNLIPFIGPVLGIIPPIIVAFVTNPSSIIWVFAVLIIVYQIIFNIVGPKLIGNVFKIHPVIVLLSFFLGAKLAGGTGAILAVPVLGAIIVIFHKLLSKFIAR